MVFNRKHIENLILVTVLTTFSGQIYLSPTGGTFRLSMAVAVLTVTLIHFRKLPVMLVCGTVAVTIPLFRSVVDYFSVLDADFGDIFRSYLPVISFYISYGFLFLLLSIREKLSHPFSFILSLWLCDSFSNILEFSLRQLISPANIVSDVLLQIILMGLARSVLTYFLYNTTLYYIERYDRSYQENRYREMIMFISSLKSELFFLQKSIADIENTMKDSYDLYQHLESGPQKEQVLSIAKNIHEIKKDYYRVASGLEKVLSAEEDRSSLNSREIFDLIRENYQKLNTNRQLHIHFEFHCRSPFITAEYYPLISVLNNLIINAVEAIQQYGRIVVEGRLEGTIYRFSVTDNGQGIHPEDLELLFIPGYSTKYDAITGRMSTGIGLCHAQEIVENHFGGSIHAESNPELGRTTFSVMIPFDRLQEVLIP
ncbi:ATP-binding protein [Anoxynatronum sibiricum]|uniref:histidine kinase n=1 Tax=Anoxynatronum sibiricum TaxID=210623 RepID=A0ABU9VPB4_9CLOT